MSKLQKIKQFISGNNLDGYIVPSTDEYQNEIVPENNNRLRYITNFTGSNGFVIILLDQKSLFFTDSRYSLQSNLELDSNNFLIFNQSELKTFNWKKYISKNKVIGIDSKICTKEFVTIFTNKINIKFVVPNLVDKVWINKPTQNKPKIYEYSLKYSGEDAVSKLKRCRDFLNKNKASSLIITNPESTSWIMNIRSSDLEFSPTVLAYSIITLEQAYLFVESERIENLLKSKLVDLNILVLPKIKFASYVATLKSKIIFDESSCPIHIYNILSSTNTKSSLLASNICNTWKSIKNETEIHNSININILDSVALCEFLSLVFSLDKNNRISSYSEYSLSQELTNFRKKNPNYVTNSFNTICAFNANAAIPHYHPYNEDTSKKIDEDGMLLIDSGGQYLGGTTDVTRTVLIGHITTPKLKSLYTKVLKGHIAIASLIFPKDEDITGAHIDILARQYLWEIYKDYKHSTGHGVGNFLSVHEGPISINKFNFKDKLEKFMIFSNEPGYYEPDEFGIRIENLVFVDSIKGESNFLKLNNLTLVPYDKSLIETSLLSPKELEYLKSYYLLIQKKIYPLLSNEAQKWFQVQNIFS